MNNKYDLSVIIPCYNAEEFLIKCVNSVIEQKGLFFEIILIDDNSNDKTWEIITNFAFAKKIKNNSNLGYAGTCDQGAKIAEGDFLAFLNCDAFLTKSTQLEEMVKILKNDHLMGVLGTVQLNEDYSFQFSGSAIDLFCNVDPFSINESHLIYNSNKNFFIMTGGAFFITPRYLYKKVCGIDKDYFLYVEEVDYMWRVQLLGYRIYTSNEHSIIHLGGASSGNEYKNITNKNKIYYRERNALITMLKNYSIFSLFIILPLYCITQIMEITFFIFMKRFDVVKYYLKVYKYCFANCKNIIKKRIIIQKRRVISDLFLIKKKKIKINYFKIKTVLVKGIPYINR